MYNELKSLLKNSYSPYSGFKVSAILETNDGKYFNGVNVENASYGACICAERSAIVSAISSGYKKGDFTKLNLMVDSDKISFPCNICRQTFVEFFEEDMPIDCYDKFGNKKTVMVSDLCTFPFNSGDLK